jgi:hypothetical protein
VRSNRIPVATKINPFVKSVSGAQRDRSFAAKFNKNKSVLLNLRPDVTLLQKIDPEVLETITKAEKVQLSAGAVIGKPDYMTTIMSKRLLKFDLLADHSIEASKQIALREEIGGLLRPSLLKTVLYRDIHTLCTDPHDALTRMLHKFLLHADQMAMSHSHVTCADEYLSIITQYDHFEKLVTCDLITTIMHEIFTIFRPGGEILLFVD